MNKKYRSYRLINRSELQELRACLSKNLAEWNQRYALFPLVLELISKPQAPCENSSMVWGDAQQGVALISQKSTAIMTRCLFGDESDCFSTISNELFIELLEQLLEISNLKPRPEDGHKEWFYTGAPTLKITLKGTHESLDIYLHPEWALSRLPVVRYSNKSAIKPIQDALDPESISLNVTFLPFSLSLDDLMCLQVGDVIKTDHLLTNPLVLQLNSQKMAQVDIGENNHQKSIQIRK